MISTIRIVGSAFLVLGYDGQQAMAQDASVDTCADLITGVTAATEASTFTMTTGLECSETITITDGQTITVEGGDATINIVAGFSGKSVFSVEEGGTLNLRNVGFEETGEIDNDESGVRAVESAGTLGITSCVFSELNGRDFSYMLTEGGAVSGTLGSNVISRVAANEML